MSIRKHLIRISYDIHPAKYKKIYLSRSKFNHIFTSTLGEKNVENIFKNNGFKILYPELEKLETVISYMKGAEIIAGVVGTNMHNILFAKDNVKVFNLNRSNHTVDFQILIDKMKNNDSYYIDSYYQILPTNLNHAVPFLIYPTKYLKEFFKDIGIKYNLKNIHKELSFDLTKYLYQYSLSPYNNFDSDITTLNNIDLVNNLKNLFNDYPIEKVTRITNETIIDKIAWWIPIRKLRDNFRNSLKKLL